MAVTPQASWLDELEANVKLVKACLKIPEAPKDGHGQKDTVRSLWNIANEYNEAATLADALHLLRALYLPGAGEGAEYNLHLPDTAIDADRIEAGYYGVSLAFRALRLYTQKRLDEAGNSTGVGIRDLWARKLAEAAKQRLEIARATAATRTDATGASGLVTVKAESPTLAAGAWQGTRAEDSGPSALLVDPAASPVFWGGGGYEGTTDASTASGKTGGQASSATSVGHPTPSGSRTPPEPELDIKPSVLDLSKFLDRASPAPSTSGSIASRSEAAAATPQSGSSTPLRRRQKRRPPGPGNRRLSPSPSGSSDAPSNGDKRRRTRSELGPPAPTKRYLKAGPADPTHSFGPGSVVLAPCESNPERWLALVHDRHQIEPQLVPECVQYRSRKNPGALLLRFVPLQEWGWAQPSSLRRMTREDVEELLEDEDQLPKELGNRAVFKECVSAVLDTAGLNQIWEDQLAVCPGCNKRDHLEDHYAYFTRCKSCQSRWHDDCAEERTDESAWEKARDKWRCPGCRLL